MRIRKLNEWKCDIDINDASVYVEPTGVLRDMIERFKLKYNHHTESYNCDGDMNLREYHKHLSYDVQEEFDKAFVRNGKMTIKFGEVKGNFLLPGDENSPYILTSLEGCPESVGGGFSCEYNQLTSLEGSPKSVEGYFDCRYNDLTSLAGCPKTVGGDFWCSNNQLTSLEGCPKKVGGYFNCYKNKVKFTQKCVRSVCDVKFEIYV